MFLKFVLLLGACGGKFNTSSGLLTSPSYPDKYPDYAYCYYTISQPMGTYITLEAVFFDLYCGKSCLDSLEIRDGNSENSPLMGKFYATDLTAPIQSSQNHMWIG